MNEVIKTPNPDGLDGLYSDPRKYPKKLREALMDRAPALAAVRLLKERGLSINDIAEGVERELLQMEGRCGKLSLPTCRNWIMRGVIPTQKKHRDALAALAASLGGKQ
jgi:hypothetical protein